MKEGIIKDIINYIQSYPKCNTEKSLKPVKAPMKVLVEDGPHFKIEMDLFYLNDDISKVCRYNYILDIVNVLSKWLYSYPLVHKTYSEVLIALRKYIYYLSTK